MCSERAGGLSAEGTAEWRRRWQEGAGTGTRASRAPWERPVRAK